ncbi:MAG: MBL fold metallo-hydrolase [Bacilli bacterium]|nr:MBL fold metallo-hydrolase [Bacilli bacterium]
MIKVFVNECNSDCIISNVYVLGKKGYSCIVVDMGKASAEIVEYIKSHHTKVEALLLTHGHYDHISGINEFLHEFPNTPIYISREDEICLSDPNFNGSNRHKQRISFDLKPILVDDGNELEFKCARVKVIHTPFHTRGSTCYFVKEDNALFTGDSLFKGSIGRSDFANSQPEKTTDSLKKLLSLNDYTVCYPGHGPVTKLKDEKRNNPFLQRLVK